MWRVSLHPEPSLPERLAARELAKDVRKMSGAKLEIVEETEPSEKAIRIDCDDGVLDGFDLTITPDAISIHGHTPRGALYGVYQILEDMGCRWYYIGELGEVVPACGQLALPAGKSSQTASFRERSVMIAYPSYYERFDQWIDFLTRSRINNIVIYGRSVKWWRENRAKYLAGGVGDAEGRRAGEILADGVKAVDEIKAWIERFPKEQNGLVTGWHNYYSSYEKVLSALEIRVRKKLAQKD